MSMPDCTLLAVESSAGPASCAVLRCQDGKQQLLCASSTNNRLTHSQTLLPMILDTLKNSDLTLANVTHLAVSVGPGSFTGIRIGVSAVKGLAFPNDLPCVAVSTLAGMARRFEGLPYNGLILTAMDARCRQIYTAVFSAENGVVSRLTPDEALSLDEVKSRLTDETRPIIIVGDGAQLCYDELKDALPNVSLASNELRYQHAIGIAQEAVPLIQQNAVVNGEALLPTYLRLSQAERELRAKQADRT